MGDFFRDHFEKQKQEFDIRKFEWECGVNRAYLVGVRGFSDCVSPQEAELYLHAGKGLVDLKVEIDTTGELSGRDTPPEGHVFAVVNEGRLISDSDTFWTRLNEGLDALEATQQTDKLETS